MDPGSGAEECNVRPTTELLPAAMMRYSALTLWFLGGIFLTFPDHVSGTQETQEAEEADATQQAQEDPCLMCHSMEAMFQATDDPARYVVTPEALAGSVHGPFGFSCSTCHQGMEFPHPENPQTSCSPCHSEVERIYHESLHGYSLARGNERAPTCASCHGNHDILSASNPSSPTHKVRLPATCAECHGQAGLLTDQLVRLPQSFQEYARSVHGQGATRGVATAAGCDDCHSVHDLKGSMDPDSPINPQNVATTCGQCHPDIQLEYDGSIHGRALYAGIRDSPTCTDCHGEHLILSPGNPDGRVYGAAQATETCGRCHDDPLIISKYGFEEGVVGSYLDSYHGWANRAGYGQAASCMDCHTAHNVLPKADPASSISDENIVATCGACHPGSTANFAASYDHRSTSIVANPVNRVIRSVYLWLIALIIGGMVLHNLVIINYFMLKRRREQASAEATVTRFTMNEVSQHLTLTVAFVVLVITGFALRYPDSFWVRGLAAIGMSEGVRGTVHRGAGVVLILISAYHAWYVLATKRGRSELKALLPSGKDVVDLVQNLRYLTFRSKKKARFARYDYSQKAEYWALVWGGVIMAITGIILWFPTAAARYLPALAIPAAQTVHYYEAILATLAILVWHFFFVIFHPEEYPMSWTWITGKMTKKSAKEHHAQWYEEELAPGDTEELETAMVGAEGKDVGSGTGD
jgi:formate dehydrogenase gamma subunit